MEPKPIMTMGPEIFAWMADAAGEDIGFGLRKVTANARGLRDQGTKVAADQAIAVMAVPFCR
jgi:hypothetical protein